MTTPPPADVVTIGETMALLTVPSDGRTTAAVPPALGIGGAESTVAIGLSRLGVGALWVSRVGDDALGRSVLREIRGEGVTVLAERDPDAPTGIMIKELSRGRARRVRYHRSGSAASRLGVADVERVADAIAAASVLHLTGITPALGPGPRAAVERAVRIAREAGTTVSFDVNDRRALWPEPEATRVLAALLADVDLVFAGTREAELVLGRPGGAPGPPVGLEQGRSGGAPGPPVGHAPEPGRSGGAEPSVGGGLELGRSGGAGPSVGGGLGSGRSGDAVPSVGRGSGAGRSGGAGPSVGHGLVLGRSSGAERAVEQGLELASALAALGPSTAVLKLGELGAVAVADESPVVARTRPVEALDPVGAGDAFVAGYLSRLVRGATVAECLETGNLLGRIVCTVPGDWEGLPTAEELAEAAGDDVLR